MQTWQGAKQQAKPQSLGFAVNCCWSLSAVLHSCWPFSLQGVPPRQLPAAALLLAVEVSAGQGEDSEISINPQDVKISPNTVGFFIAQSAEEVKRWEVSNN